MGGGSRRDEAAQRTRAGFAGLLGTEPGNIALVQSAAGALPAGARVVVGAEEYRSNLFPWLAARKRGVRPDRLEELRPPAPSPKITERPWRDYYGHGFDDAGDVSRVLDALDSLPRTA